MADIIFTGNLGADAQPGYTRGGSPVLNFRVCDTKSKKDGNGGWDKVSEQWFQVELWGSMAEFLADQLLSGVRVKVYGQFYSREYADRQGTPRTSLDVKASAVEVLTSNRDRQKLAAQNQEQPSTSQGDGWGNAHAPTTYVEGWGNGPTPDPTY